MDDIENHSSVLVEYRTEQEGDLAGIADVHRKAFGREAEANVVNALRVSPHFVPGLSLVAILGGRVVAHILLTRITIREDGVERPALSLAPMAVHPDQQRGGIGSALIRCALQEAERLGHSVVVVLGHADYYPRFGFTRASRFGIRPPFVAPDEAFLVCELRAGGLDGLRGVVQYPPEFSKS